MSYKAGYAALSEEETIVNGGRSRRVDAFWGVAYVEPKRLYRTFMTAPYWHSPLALIVPHANATGEIVSSESLRSQISDDFLKPFSYELWRSIIYLFLFAGIFYAGTARTGSSETHGSITLPYSPRCRGISD